MDAYIRFADALLDRLVWTSIQATALIGAVWLLCRWLPRWSPAMRCLLWWLVGLQLVLGLALGRPLELPLLAPPAASASLPQALGSAIQTSVTGSPWITAPVPMAAASKAPDVPASRPWPWRETLAGLWLVAMALHIVAALREWRETRAVIRTAEPVLDASLREQCIEQARALGLRRCPRLLRSDVIVSPQVTGLWRPVVLLPKEHTLAPDECAMALAHELAHLRRGDLWLGWIPALAQRAFFFHPLVRWAVREYALHREAACDAQVLDRSHAEPQDYGRLLVRLGVAFPVASGLAGASPTFQNLKRRLTLLQQTDRVPPRLGAWLLVALVALAGALPYRVTARGMDMTVHAYDGAAPKPTPAPASTVATRLADAGTPTKKPPQSSLTATAALSPVPAAPAAMAATAAPMAAMAPIPAPPAPRAAPAPKVNLPPMPPAPPPAPAAPPAPPMQTSVRTGHATHVDIDVEAVAPRGFAIVEPDSITLKGDESDLVRARSLQRGQESLLWIRRGNDAYLVRDRALLQRALDTYAPMRDMARQQGQMAGRQGELSGRQSGLAARESALSVRRVELDRERVTLMNERQKLHLAPQGGDTEEARAAASLDSSLRSVQQQMADVDSQQAEIGRERADFDRRQADLSRQQADMAKQEHEIARQVDGQMDRLIDEALAGGLAQRAESL